MPTEHHYTRQSANGKPGNGTANPNASTHSARNQSHSAQHNTHSKQQYHDTSYPKHAEYASKPHPQGKGAASSGADYPRGAADYSTRNSQSVSGGYQSQYDRSATSGRSQYRSSAEGYQTKSGKNASAYASQYTQGQTARKKKKPFSLKRFWKKLRKNILLAMSGEAKSDAAYTPKTPATNVNSFVAGKDMRGDAAYTPRTTAIKGKNLGKQAKKTVLSVIKTIARGAYLGVRKFYQYLMKLPPRTLLVGSSAFGLLVLAVIILAVALPGKDSSADAQEQLAAFASEDVLSAAVDSSSTVSDTNSADALNTDTTTTDATGTEAVTTAETNAVVFTGELCEGDNGEIVTTIQTRLMELGYMDSDEPTQHFGPLTQSALRAFQRHNGLDDDGICGKTTYDMLMNPEAKVYVMQLGDSGPDVEGVQQRLYELGYLDNKANIVGTFGEKTEVAAKLFQKKNDLTADGKVGSRTLEMLYGEDVVGNAFYLGAENQTIEDCQVALKRLGYITFKPDGVMGKATVSAIKAFQQANGLTRDGALGPATRDLLLSGDAQEMVMQLGDYGTAVKTMQQRLAKLNYLASANATGYFGEITADAVKAFQKRSGLSQDGKVGAVTLTMLNSSSAKKASTPPSTTKESSSGSSSSSGGSSSSGSSGSDISGASNMVGVEKIVALAESKIGCTYVRGAKGPNSFDCSGFVYWCLKNSGVSASYMTSIAWRNTSRYQRMTNLSAVQRGDILVFSGETDSTGHVGIYLGGGKMIDASSSEGKVRQSSTVLSSGGYWSKHFICAYRVF